MSDPYRDDPRGPNPGYDYDRNRVEVRRGGNNQELIIALIAAATIIIVLLILVFSGVLGGNRATDTSVNVQTGQAPLAPGNGMAAAPVAPAATAPVNGMAAAPMPAAPAPLPAPAATATAAAFPAQFRGNWCNDSVTERLVITSDQIRVERLDGSGTATSQQSYRLRSASGSDFATQDNRSFSIFEGPGNPAAIRGGRQIEVDLTSGPLTTYEQC